VDTEKNLVLIFLNHIGSQVRLNVLDVREGIMSSEVQTAMENIIAKNVFTSDGGDLLSVAGAQIVTRTVQDLITV
jgi:hypothetical protein